MLRCYIKNSGAGSGKYMHDRLFSDQLEIATEDGSEGLTPRDHALDR